MRSLKPSVRRHIGTIQGVLGAVCTAAGAYLVWGLGIALLTLGGFLLIGAWGSE